jgi:hypothetical protein
MKYAILGLVALLGVSACAKLDEYLPRDVQCMLLDAAEARALEQGVPVAEVKAELARQGIVLCPVATVEEAVEDGFTVVE